MKNKHSDACIYLPPYKLDVLKIVEYKFSCEMEAHVEVTSLMFDCNTLRQKAFTHFSSYYFAIQRATVLPLHYADQLKVGKHVFRRNRLSVLLLEIQDIYLF